MPTGLRIKDPSTGRVKIDTQTNIGTLLGIVQTGGKNNPATGEVYNEKITQGLPFFFVIDGPIQFAREDVYPTFYFEGAYFKWTYPDPRNEFDYHRPPCKILYGIT